MNQPDARSEEANVVGLSYSTKSLRELLKLAVDGKSDSWTAEFKAMVFRSINELCDSAESAPSANRGINPLMMALESKEFFELCQRYRHVNQHGRYSEEGDTVKAYEALKKYIIDNSEAVLSAPEGKLSDLAFERYEAEYERVLYMEKSTAMLGTEHQRMARRAAYELAAFERSVPAVVAETDNDKPGRIPELEQTRKHAKYWEGAARNEPERESALQCLHQAMLSWKNAAYAAWDKINSAPSGVAGSERETKRIYKDSIAYPEYLKARFDKTTATALFFVWEGKKWKYEYTDFDETGEFDVLIGALKNQTPATGDLTTGRNQQATKPVEQPVSDPSRDDKLDAEWRQVRREYDAELAKDAERYRWLRACADDCGAEIGFMRQDRPVGEGWVDVGQGVGQGQSLDAAIDAAMNARADSTTKEKP